MDILTALCSIPTAPFAEERVVDFVSTWVAKRPNLRLRHDDAGNLLIERPGRRHNSPRWVFAAHMDHPGMIARKMSANGKVEADFYGSVLAGHLKNAPVRFFADSREICGKIIASTTKNGSNYPTRCTIRLNPKAAVEPGTLAMFDHGPGRRKAGKFYSRVCDNLAGAAAALSLLDALAKKPATATVAVLLTRAEEVGFVGAIAAVLKPKLLRKTDRMVIIECSAAQPAAPLGNGPVVRVGDRTSIFNSALTWFITDQAEQMQKADAKFKFQRALMPGGTCEATVYDLYGYTAASICVPLGNYHNMDRAKRATGPEFISIADWNGMVRLFERVARHAHEFDPANPQLRQRIEQRYEKLKHLLAQSPGRARQAGS